MPCTRCRTWHPGVVSFTFADNSRSERVMQRLGMTPAGEFNHTALPRGHPLRHVLSRMQT